MLTIRLRREGKRKEPSYRLIVNEKAKDPWGTYLELLGTYNPLSNPPAVNFKAERIKYWISKGAQCSDTVWNILVEQKVLQGEKRQKVRISRERRAKMEKAKAAA
jgi:small subunit ribosomal protein S16